MKRERMTSTYTVGAWNEVVYVRYHRPPWWKRLYRAIEEALR